MKSKQVEERGLLERARMLYPWFPPGETCSGDDPPDFVHHSEGERIAIEVTRIFQPSADRTHARREVESFHQRIMRRAEERARAAGLPVLDVLVYFSDREPLSLDRSVALLVGFVRGHPVDRCETFDLPDAAGIIRIAKPLAGRVPVWTCGEGGSEASLTRKILAETINKKDADLPKYRSGYDQVWLLMASTLFPLSASFSVPDEIETWRFASGFDRLLFLSEPHGKVFRLLPGMESEN